MSTTFFDQTIHYWDSPELAAQVFALPPVGKTNVYHSVTRAIIGNRLRGTLGDLHSLVSGATRARGIGPAIRHSLRLLLTQIEIDEILAADPSAHEITPAELIRLEKRERVLIRSTEEVVRGLPEDQALQVYILATDIWALSTESTSVIEPPSAGHCWLMEQLGWTWNFDKGQYE